MVTAELVSAVILQLLTAAQSLASRQASGQPITAADLAAAFQAEAATHQALVTLIAASEIRA